MHTMMISRNTFGYLMLTTQSENVTGFLHRYFAISEREAKDLWNEIVEGCWNKALMDESVLCYPKKLARNVAKEVAITFLRNNGYFADLLA